ncbi:CCA tRNA nucleotidyltransferase, partial [Phenylobacterium sp.]|uniref:CCA tRNA nucleotidyltransferase n=1 Tax=Phenylobacterium sp. TaxID=1871053 RepID=UPI002E2F329E
MSAGIGPAPWMTAKETVAVLDALEDKGGPDCARFVGGCVRDAVLGRPVSDIDIATPLTPDEVTQALKAAGIRAVPTGIEHGTVTAVCGGKPFEITTLRRDVSTDGRRAVVAFTKDWMEDAQRRDFTLNALYAKRDGEVFDSSGRGVEDARAGRIVFMGEPVQRILEDHLRILRFFRFFAWFGRGEPGAAALAACAEHKGAISNLAAERISAELLKLLAADDPRLAVRLMAQTGVLGVALPEAAAIGRFEGLVEIESEQLFETDAVLRLAAMMPNDRAIAPALAERLRLSNEHRDRIAAALGEQPPIKSWMSARETRRTVYALGHQTFRDRVKLAWATASSTATAPQWRGLIALGEGWSAPSFPLNGDEVVRAGVPRGPLV